MNFEQQTGSTIGIAFVKFHKANPQVFELWCKFSNMLIARQKMISTNLVINRIRWEIYFESNTRDEDEFKINNNFCPWYGRLWIKKYPQHADKIRFREIRSNDNEDYILALAMDEIKEGEECQMTMF